MYHSTSFRFGILAALCVFVFNANSNPLDQLKNKSISEKQRVLATYIIARESVDPKHSKAFDRIVRDMSTPAVLNAWLKSRATLANDKSAKAVGIPRQVLVNSVAILGPNFATFKFLVYPASKKSAKAEIWTGLITFKAGNKTGKLMVTKYDVAIKSY